MATSVLEMIGHKFDARRFRHPVGNPISVRMNQSAEELEKLARTIVFACVSPSFQDVAAVENTGEVIKISFGRESITLALTDPHLPLRVAYLKRRVVRITQDLRAHAMLKAVSLPTDTIPPWLITTHTPIAEWIAWAGCLDEILKCVRASGRSSSGPLINGRINFDIEFGGQHMLIRGGLHRGVLSATIDLGTTPDCRYVDDPQPRIIVDATAIPESVIDALNRPQERSNRGLRLGDIVEHRFLSAYDAPVANVRNHDGAVEIILDTSYSILAPVPTAALRAVPRDADPARPFDLTRSEREALRVLTRGGMTTIR